MDLQPNTREADYEESGCTTTYNGSAMKLVQTGPEADDVEDCTTKLDGSLMELVQGTPKLGPCPVEF